MQNHNRPHASTPRRRPYPPFVVPLRLVRLLIGFLLVPPAGVVVDGVVSVGLPGGLPTVPAEELHT